MSQKIKKRKITFLIVLVLCSAILIGGIIYTWKGEKVAKNINKLSPSEKHLPPHKSPLSVSVNRVKIKKTSDPNILSWKDESEYKGGSSFSEFNTKKENIPNLFSGSGFEKGIWIDDWEKELKDNCWLVKEKRQEAGQIAYASWYENDQSEKLKELGSRKWW